MAAIDDLEERLSDLADARERSRKFERGGMVAAWAGGAVFVAWLFGWLLPGPVGLATGVALGLGGLVLAGSSRTTTARLEDSITELDLERRAAIDSLQLTPVPPERNDRPAPPRA